MNEAHLSFEQVTYLVLSGGIMQGSVILFPGATVEKFSSPERQPMVVRDAHASRKIPLV